MLTVARPAALACALGCPLVPPDAGAQAHRAITPDDLLAMHRVGDPQLSPDGTEVVYTVGTPDT